MRPEKQIIASLIWLSLIALLVGCGDSRESTQIAQRGISMLIIEDSDDIAETAKKNIVPQSAITEVALDGPRASEAFENVQVLGDTSVPQFTRLMTAMTEWVAADEGCVYCHVATDFASDALYTKVVARRMLEMAQHINMEWKDHVKDTGVTCYTCHRGNPVPEYLWFEGHPEPETGGLNARRRGQNLATSEITISSLPQDPFSSLLLEDDNIRVQSNSAMPAGEVGSRDSTENTYSLMIHMSQALGVNCLHCHSSRAFSNWEQSSPARVQAWYGIRMVRDLNSNYLVPLESHFPDKRRGPNGDGPKLFCATCHQGVYKPLYGESMVGPYPSLRPDTGMSTGAADLPASDRSLQAAVSATDSEPPAKTID